MNKKTVSNPVIIKDVPAEEKDNFPKFLAGIINVVDPLDEPSTCKWQFEFKGQYCDRSERFFIWQIRSGRDEETLALRYLAEKAKMFGLVHLWIYSICRPCTAELQHELRVLNSKF